MFCMISHDLIGASIFYFLGSPISHYIIYETLGMMFGGLYIACIFSLNHTHKPTVEAFSERNWVRRSIEFTTNSHPSFFNSWFTGYLCFQIEHHLFPSIPHPRLFEVSKRVKALCLKNNLPYDSQPLSSSIYKTYKNLVDVGAFAYEENEKKKN